MNSSRSTLLLHRLHFTITNLSQSDVKTLNCHIPSSGLSFTHLPPKKIHALPAAHTQAKRLSHQQVLVLLPLLFKGGAKNQPNLKVSHSQLNTAIFLCIFHGRAIHTSFSTLIQHFTFACHVAARSVSVPVFVLLSV